MGTVLNATTAGTTADSEADEPPIRFRGDEADLYLAYNSDLVKSIAATVRGLGPADVEDACAFAWVQFFRYQPDRDQRWQGWLFRTAQREAWSSALPGRTAEVPGARDEGGDRTSEPADPRERLDERLEFLALEEPARAGVQRVASKRNSSAAVLAWRRAALAIDDYRRDSDVRAFARELPIRRELRERPPADPALVAAALGVAEAELRVALRASRSTASMSSASRASWRDRAVTAKRLGRSATSSARCTPCAMWRSAAAGAQTIPAASLTRRRQSNRRHPLSDVDRSLGPRTIGL